MDEMTLERDRQSIQDIADIVSDVTDIDEEISDEQSARIFIKVGDHLVRISKYVLNYFYIT